MKSLMTKIAIVGTIALGTVASAQGPGPGHGPGGGFLGGMIGHALNLTDAQKEQIKSIVKDAFDSNQTLHTQLKAAHEAERAAIKAGKSDAELAQLAQGYGPLHTQLYTARLQAEAKIYKVLTPEQQAKFEEIRGKMQEHFGEAVQRFRQRHGGEQ